MIFQIGYRVPVFTHAVRIEIQGRIDIEGIAAQTKARADGVLFLIRAESLCPESLGSDFCLFDNQLFSFHAEVDFLSHRLPRGSDTGSAMISIIPPWLLPPL